MRVHEIRPLRKLYILVWNPTEHRVRAGWRFVLSFVAILGAVLLAAGVPVPVTGKLQSVALELVLRACFVFGVAVVLVRVLDRRSLRDLGFTPSLRWGYRFLVGISTAFIIVSGATVTLVVTGWATVDATIVSQRVAFGPALFLTVVYAVCVGVWEETLFRGLLLRNGAEGLAGWFPRRHAVLVSLGTVALLHALLRLPGLSSTRVLPFYVLVSGLYGLAYVLTGDLAVPVGLHAGVDFAALGVFGFHDPSTFPALVDLRFTGPGSAVGVDGLVMFGWVVIGCLLLVVLRKHLFHTERGALLSLWQGRNRHASS